MAIEIKVPGLPESVSDATVLTWHKKAGEAVRRDENLVDLETDKVVLEVPSPVDGILKEINIPVGEKVTSNQLLGSVEEGAGAGDKIPPNPPLQAKGGSADVLSPSVRRAAAEKGVDATQLQGTGREGRVTKEDVIASSAKISSAAAAASSSLPAEPAKKQIDQVSPLQRREERVPMSRLRQRIAERLLGAQQNAAILTTFNEINLKAVIELRQTYKDQFEKTHQVKLGFMSFFTRAVTEALKKFPFVNASIEGPDILYHHYYDIGVAVSTERGLVVPVLKNADQMSLAQIEKHIGDFGKRAKNNQLSLEEITGGTFTITNGGVFGSLLSTPILNPPQSAILGMHKIQERPVVENGQIVIRPMMYVALSYDHRIVDGKDSVGFLVTVKALLEEPARLLLEI
jgi:2-oxoglutarate dehydrogenase E2 component (dihydrolipoamide succinyltransferase)